LKNLLQAEKRGGRNCKFDSFCHFLRHLAFTSRGIARNKLLAGFSA